MTKSKNTKRALLASVLSVLLCVAMLVGSTFAWFTDSVTSGKNRIVAGNLDIELEYAVPGEDGTIAEDAWKTVEGATDLFKQDALWEPGYTEVVYLRVKNAGTLALKYKFGINVASKVIGKTADNKDIDLSDYIKFGVVETETATKFNDRLAARDAVKDGATPISSGYSSKEGHLTAGGYSNIIALVVYMPEEVGNEANYRGETIPSIDIGVNLVATQDTVETDSFGKDYDKNAKYPSVWDGKTVDTSWYEENPDSASFTLDDASEIAGLAELVKEGKDSFKGKTLYLDCNIDWNGNEWTYISGDRMNKAFQGTFDGQNYVIKNAVLSESAENVGLFGFVWNGTVKNLEIKDVIIQNGGSVTSGIVAGTLYNGTVENVKVTGNSSVSGKIRAGGIVGSVKGTKSVVKDCENHADVTVNSMYAGGIAAAAHSGGGSQIIGCTNYGTIKSATETGGIVGYTDRAVITDCINYGDVTATGDYGAGGIIGFDACNLSSQKNGSTITGCVNNGTITAPRAGGIMGTYATVPGKTQPSAPIYATIDSCINNGNIVQTNGQTDRSGTIFGYQHSYAKGDADENINNLVVKIINCKNTGTLNGEKTNVLTPSKYVEIS